MAATELKTNEYVFAHGKAPRGRGCWAFKPVGGTDEAIVWLTGTLTECRKQLPAGRWIVCS
jgi:hypothetical protein